MDKKNVTQIVRSFVRDYPMVGTNVRDWRPERSPNFLENTRFNSLHKLKRNEKEFNKTIDINAEIQYNSICKVKNITGEYNGNKD